jgi:hypothetical protein
MSNNEDAVQATIEAQIDGAPEYNFTGVSQKQLHIDPLVRLVVLRQSEVGENRVTMAVIAAEFDLSERDEDGGHKARIMTADETPDTPGGFVDAVRTDVAALVTELVIRVSGDLRETESRDDTEGKQYINLLHELSTMPVELIGNALAALIVGTAENLVELPDDEYSGAVDSLRASASGETDGEPEDLGYGEPNTDLVSGDEK